MSLCDNILFFFEKPIQKSKAFIAATARSNGEPGLVSIVQTEDEKSFPLKAIKYS